MGADERELLWHNTSADFYLWLDSGAAARWWSYGRFVWQEPHSLSIVDITKAAKRAANGIDRAGDPICDLGWRYAIGYSV